VQHYGIISFRSVTLLVATAALFAATTTSDDAAACSCAPPGTPTEELAKSDSVFEATVEKIDDVPAKMDPVTGQISGGAFAHMKVERTWNGALPRTHAVVQAGVAGGMCGYQFTVGKRYVVYTHLVDGQLRTSICSRTRLSEYAREDLKALGPGKTELLGLRSG
jgi:hypothetical protein